MMIRAPRWFVIFAREDGTPSTDTGAALAVSSSGLSVLKKMPEENGATSTNSNKALWADMWEASAVMCLVWIPLAYMADAICTDGENIDLTAELLADAVRLTHPDCHPPERQELARRDASVTRAEAVCIPGAKTKARCAAA